MQLLRIALFAPLFGSVVYGQRQTVEVAQVVAKRLERIVKLPGEILPYESVALHARVSGYVEQVLVDRGSAVRKGQLLVRLSAPEVAAQVAEAQSKAQAADSQRAEAEAQLAGAQSTYDRLKEASATAGAISGNELLQAEKTVDAAKALVRSRESAVQAAQAAARAVQALEQYLEVTAPFAGVITERFVHPGALVGPANAEAALLELQQVTRLRLVVAVPEADAGGILRGGRVTFTVPAFAGQTFSGVVARIGRALDPKNRTMPVELDVRNARGILAPGMFPEVSWPVHTQGEALLVPLTSLVTTTERSFVIRVANGRAEWVDVRRGPAAGDRVQVSGSLRPGDVVVRRGTDEIHDGAPLQVRASK